jgi:hypothetical protein
LQQFQISKRHRSAPTDVGGYDRFGVWLWCVSAD